MPDYSLHCMAESGNAYKAALMLELCGADWQPIWVDFFKGATRGDDFRELNPMGEVPLLVDHKQDDRLISQSSVIMLHLSDRFGKFVPDNRPEELEMLRWMFWDNHKLTSYNSAYRFMRVFLKKDGEPEAEFMKARGRSALDLLNRHLDTRDWIVTSKPTLADISCCGYLFWPDHIDVSWDDYPGIKNWLERIKSIEGWKPAEEIMPNGPAQG